VGLFFNPGHHTGNMKFSAVKYYGQVTGYRLKTKQHVGWTVHAVVVVHVEGVRLSLNCGQHPLGDMSTKPRWNVIDKGK
jgi:hypothetical protein